MNFLLQLYGEIDDLSNSRILDELDFYMYEIKHSNKNELIYYFTKEQTIFISLSPTTDWDLSKLHVLIRTALRENQYIIVPITNYTGYMDQYVWDNMKIESVKFFEDTKAMRISMGRSNKLSKLKSLIKRLPIILTGDKKD